ncbi:uncharacterized protein LOC117340463 [Pecten maximus]|uniref:uncharacterized protein LOC117340463 n=1 Tax=Pecten maximus TaxID=6579 RepID=UPI001458936F|nr:uncharacterized protein LOC117340463 [Pecten maximus]
MGSMVFYYILFLLAASEVHCSNGDANQTLMHMLGFLKNKVNSNHLGCDVIILNPNNDNASINISSQDGQLRNVILQSLYAHTETFNQDFEVDGSGLSRKGIKVTSDRQLFVYGISRHTLGFEGFLSLPTHYQGNHYFVITGSSQSEFLIVGIYPGTCVHVLLRTTFTKVTYKGNSYKNGSTITEILNEYSTMKVYAAASDFTGTEIRSSRTVSVFNGNKLIGRNNGKNHLVEQLPPSDNWGQAYVTTGPIGFTYDCKIMSGFPNTCVNYTCSTNVTEYLDLPEAGSYRTLQFNNKTCFLTSNKPILVTILIFRDYDTRPCLITLPALEEVRYTMVYVPAAMDNAQLIIVTNENITVNNATDETILTYVECPSYINTCIHYVKILRRNQTYTIRSTKQHFVISAYIHGTRCKGNNCDDRGIGYPILYHTPKGNSEHKNVTCSESSGLPDSSTEDPSSPLVQNRSCQCCSSRNSTANYTKEDLAAMLTLLREKLYVHRKKTNMYIRSLISAPDYRVSSKVIGYTCGCVLGLLGICLVLLDIRNLLKMFKNIRRNIFSR